MRKHVNQAAKPCQTWKKVCVLISCHVRCLCLITKEIHISPFEVQNIANTKLIWHIWYSKIQHFLLFGEFSIVSGILATSYMFTWFFSAASWLGVGTKEHLDATKSRVKGKEWHSTCWKGLNDQTLTTVVGSNFKDAQNDVYIYR